MADNAPNFDAMTPEEIMAWMESLAKRQGADSSGFTTEANVEIPEVDPDSVVIDEPGYIPSEGKDRGKKIGFGVPIARPAGQSAASAPAAKPAAPAAPPPVPAPAAKPVVTVPAPAAKAPTPPPAAPAAHQPPHNCQFSMTLMKEYLRPIGWQTWALATNYRLNPLRPSRNLLRLASRGWKV